MYSPHVQTVVHTCTQQQSSDHFVSALTYERILVHVCVALYVQIVYDSL